MTEPATYFSPQHKAACEWAARGIPVFPCKPGAKEPDTPNGLYDATLDRAQIDEWWRNSPERNVGAAPDAGGYWVLDIDTKKADGYADLANLELDHETLPRTLTVSTPSGGEHCWFRGQAPSTVRKIAPGLDSRGTGGYVLLPGSVLDAGGRYELADDFPVAEAPPWLVALATATRTKEKAVTEDLDLPVNIDRARKYLEQLVARGDVAVEGEGGNNRTYQLATTLRDFGLSLDTAIELAVPWNDACEPPWDPDEFGAIFEHAFEYAQNEGGSKGVSPIEKYAKIAPQGQELNTKQSRSRFYPLDEDEQDALTSPAWVVEGWFPKVGTALLYGPWGSYKSFVATELALSRAAGMPFYGVPSGPGGPTVYAAGEGAIGMSKKRRPAWREARKIEGRIPFWTIPAVPQASPEALQEFIDAIDARGIKPTLIVIDTAARALVGLDENSAKDVSLLIEACDTLSRVYECLVLVLHHTGHSDKGRARGSSALPAGFDVLLRVEADKETMTATLSCDKQKDAEEPTPLYLQGRRVAHSLVFDTISEKEHHALKVSSKINMNGVVARALKDLGADTPAAACTTKELALKIVSMRTETPLPPEQAEQEADSVTRDLRRLSKDRLAAYLASTDPKVLMWSFPADENI